MNAEELSKKLLETFNEFQKNVKKPHVLIAGPTRVGKSSLINKIFGEKLAEEGKGTPVTDSVKKYEKEDIGVILYDSPGCEIGEENIKKFEREVLNIDKPINLVWYCINAIANIEDNDIETIKKFIERKKEKGWDVSVVFTNCDRADEERIENSKEAIKKHFNDIDIYITSSKVEHKIFKEEFERLIRDAIRKLPDALKDAFISAQKVNLDEKWNRAHEIILKHSAISGVIGLIPIPFADAPILVVNECGMIIEILHIYDLDGLKATLTGGAGGGLIGYLMTYLGKFLSKQAITNLLKLIPGAQIVGSLVSGSVASILTAGVGEAVNLSCYKLYEEILKGNDNIDLVKMFGDMVQKYAEDDVKSGKKPEDYKKPE